jgi:hypothetical protein
MSENESTLAKLARQLESGDDPEAPAESPVDRVARKAFEAFRESIAKENERRKKDNAKRATGKLEGGPEPLAPMPKPSRRVLLRVRGEVAVRRGDFRTYEECKGQLSASRGGPLTDAEKKFAERILAFV